jgi:hypothetical protein
MTITVPVLANALPGAQFSLDLTPSFNVTGTFTVGGSPQKIYTTLAGNAILDFRRVIVQNPGAPPVTFFAVLHQPYVYRPLLETAFLGVQPIFPLQLFQVGSTPPTLSPELFAIQNIEETPVNVTFRNQANGDESVYTTLTQTTVPPGMTYAASGYQLLHRQELSPAQPSKERAI